MARYTKSRLKYVCTSFNSSISADNLTDEEEYAVYGAAGLMGYNSRFRCGEEYLGIVKDGAGVGRIKKYPAKTSLLGTMAYIMPNEDIDINWLKYCIDSLNLSESLDKTTIPHIYFSEYGNRNIFCPSKKIQEKIASFLDSKCTEIEALLKCIQLEIETLEGYKKSIINEAVTKGLEQGAEMKKTGVQWLGSIPVQWEIVPSKYLFKNSELRKKDNDELLTASQTYGIITQTDYMEKTGAKIVLANQGLDKWKHVEPNNFIISLRSFQGGLEMSEISGCITWHYVVLKSDRHIYHRFYKWLFKSTRYINALQATCNFIRDGQDLRYSNFAQVPLVVLSFEEQRKIADYLDKKVSNIDATIQLKKRQIEVLEEYKKSIIYEYVTGKKEVPLS